jgi:3-hydroxyisobutyrate dehydrogenase-like beta-hydroxyacid dehydrogenase
MTEVLGFVGLDRIGRRVIPDLLKAGHDVAVFDLNSDAVVRLAEQGARAVPSPAEAARGASIVFLSLPTSQLARKAVTAEDGVLEGAPQGAVIVDHSMSDPRTARDLAAAARAGGFGYLDAPVIDEAQLPDLGSLTVLIGGEAATFARVRPVLAAFADNIFHVGPSGSGQALKLADNDISAAKIVVLREGLSATTGAEDDLDTAVAVLSKRAAAGVMLTSHLGRTFFSGDRMTGFSTDLMFQDIELFLEFSPRTHCAPLL